MAVPVEQRREIIRQEVTIQTPDDEVTRQITDELLGTVMRNGHEPNALTAFKVAYAAAEEGDVRTAAIALKSIPSSDSHISVEDVGRVLLDAVRTRRDILLDQYQANGSPSEVPHELAVTQASMNELRRAFGVLKSQSPLLKDPYVPLGSRRTLNGTSEPIPPLPGRSGVSAQVRGSSRRM